MKYAIKTTGGYVGDDYDPKNDKAELVADDAAWQFDSIADALVVIEEHKPQLRCATIVPILPKMTKIAIE